MKHLAVLLGLLSLFLIFAHRHVRANAYGYDEADYMFAAGRGFVANYLDSPSYSFLEFVRIGLSRGRDNGGSGQLSAMVRRNGDIYFYRHSHGPLYFYWLMAVSAIDPGEQFVRGLSLVFPILSAIAIYFGCLWLIPGPRGWIAAILGSAMFLLNPATITTTEVAPHQLFVTCFIVTLMLLAKVMLTGQRNYWYAALLTTALTFSTLEIAFVLVPVILVCGYLERDRLGMNLPFALRSAGLFLATLLVIYPAALLKLALGKAYLFMAYLAVARTSPWGDVTLPETWAIRFRNSPVEWILIAAALVMWFRWRLKFRVVIPFLLFGATMLVITLPVRTDIPRYSLPFLPAFEVFAAIVLSAAVMQWRFRVVATAAACAALVVSAWAYSSTHVPQPGPNRFDRLVAGVRDRNLGSARLLVSQYDVPTLHYYFPNADLTSYIEEPLVADAGYDALIRNTDPVRIEIPAR